MTPQSLAWIVSLALVFAVTLGFIWIAAKAGQSTDQEARQTLGGFSGAPDPYQLRRAFMFVLLGLGVVLTVITVPPRLYTAQNQAVQSAQEVDVVGAMWYWQLSTAQVQTGRPVLFKVTSADVNHGFGIYDQDLRLLTQTQAMPGYVNRLTYTFTQPGTYRLMCLEYCGLAHHAMIGVLEVIAAEEGD